MRKTWLSVVTALLLAAVSVALIVGRWHVLGAEVDGIPGASAWKVTLRIDGELAARDGSVAAVLPLDFRGQHITDEAFDRAELTHKVRRRKDAGPRRAVWQRRMGTAGGQPFHLVYSFRCVLGMRRPTPDMVLRTRAADAPPSEGHLTRPAPGVESDDPQISLLADALAPEDADSARAVRAFFGHVAGLGSEDGPADALECLRQGGDDAAGKSRLLVALCRSRAIPARVVSGLVLDGDGERKLHYWAEAWVEDRWLPMDPAHGHFGARRFPDTYLVLQLGDSPAVAGHAARFQFRYEVTDLHNALGPQPAPPPSLARTVWRKLTLANLPPETQEWVKFLLLLPVAALIVSVFRTIIGISTFGTFGPALLGLVCRDLHDFPWALGAFVLIMLAGWGVRRVLDRFHLLLVPRISVLLTAIVILLLLAVLLLSPYGVPTGSYIALLPLIILTHMVERFWTVETEDGTRASFLTLLGTVVVSVTVGLAVNFDVVVNGAARLFHHGPLVPPGLLRTTLFRYPEALGLVLAAQFLVGRYTGYRLTELFRFHDLLLLEGQAPGRKHELADALHAPEGDGHPGDEPPQHGVHPGPEPAAAVPPGGRQAADARPVPGDRGADA
jgi:hypothetical protein